MEKLTNKETQRLRDVVRILGLDHQEYDLVAALVIILEGRLWEVSQAEREEIDQVLQWAVHDAVDYEERMRVGGDPRPIEETTDASITLKWVLERGRRAFMAGSPLQ